MNRRPKAYESSALPLSYPAIVGTVKVRESAGLSTLSVLEARAKKSGPDWARSKKQPVDPVRRSLAVFDVTWSRSGGFLLGAGSANKGKGRKSEDRKFDEFHRIFFVC